VTFKALVVDKTDDGITQTIETHTDEQLPEGNVTVNVEYSTLNYKDGLCLTGNGGLVRTYPQLSFRSYYAASTY